MDTQLYKRLCPSVRPLVGRSVTLELKSGKTRISALPTRPQLVAVYPALFKKMSYRVNTLSHYVTLFFIKNHMIKHSLRL